MLRTGNTHDFQLYKGLPWRKLNRLLNLQRLNRCIAPRRYCVFKYAKSKGLSKKSSVPLSEETSRFQIQNSLPSTSRFQIQNSLPSTKNSLCRCLKKHLVSKSKKIASVDISFTNTKFASVDKKSSVPLSKETSRFLIQNSLPSTSRDFLSP
jgi:hypothetical protein